MKLLRILLLLMPLLLVLLVIMMPLPDTVRGINEARDVPMLKIHNQRNFLGLLKVGEKEEKGSCDPTEELNSHLD